MFTICYDLVSAAVIIIAVVKLQLFSHITVSAQGEACYNRVREGTAHYSVVSSQHLIEFFPL